MTVMRRLSVLMVAGVCLAGCGGSDRSAPNPPSSSAALESQAPASKPSPDSWTTSAGGSALTQPATQAAPDVLPSTQPASAVFLSDKKGIIHHEDDVRARELIAQVYAELKANKIDDAEATMDQIHHLRHEKPLSDAIRFMEIPQAQDAILSARTGQVMDSGSTQPGK